MSGLDDIAVEDVLEGDADAEAYNEQVEARFEERLQELAEQEQAAVSALLDEAEASAETEIVEFPSGLEIEVWTRIPVDVEHRLERIEQLEQEDAPIGEIAVVNCEALAGMCVTEGYDSAETWLAAYEKNGIHWLGEMTSRVTAPATENAESLGNRRGR
jgi:hypothetical protein